MNGLKHGGRSQVKIREFQRIRRVLRLVARNIEQVRLLLRLRDARPRIKYKFLPPQLAQAVCGESCGNQISKPRAPNPTVSASAP